MKGLSPQMKAGCKLRELIERDYKTQEEFAYEYGAEIRTVSRYVNSGINKLDVIQSLADFFGVEFEEFFK